MIDFLIFLSRPVPLIFVKWSLSRSIIILLHGYIYPFFSPDIFYVINLTISSYETRRHVQWRAISSSAAAEKPVWHSRVAFGIIDSINPAHRAIIESPGEWRAVILLNPLVHYSSTVCVEPVVRTIVVVCMRALHLLVHRGRSRCRGRRRRTHLPVGKAAPSKSS